MKTGDLGYTRALKYLKAKGRKPISEAEYHSTAFWMLQIPKESKDKTTKKT